MPRGNNSLIQSLHFHTQNSDGSWTYSESLDWCRRYRLGALAFTDHDALPAKKDLEKLASLKSHPVRYVLGVELSAGRLKELRENVPLLHVVGLFINPLDKSLVDYCRLRQFERVKRAKKMVTNLQRLGFEISWAQVKDSQKGLSVGSPHIAKALMDHPSNRVLVGRLIRDLKKRSFSDGALREKYQKMRAVPKMEMQLYALFLKEAALIPGIYVAHSDRLDLDGAVSLIRGAGGLSFLAHWSFSKPVLNEDLVEKLARQRRIDGLETVYGIAADGKEGSFSHDYSFLKKVARENDLLVSGGGDIHHEKELRSFARSFLAVSTKGMAEKLIEKAKPSLRWTSFG